jgi:hypothetical protein
MANKVAGGAAEALGGMLAKSLFLDKPLDVTTTAKTLQRPATSFALASGVDGAEILAMHIENHVATDPTVYTTPVDYMLAKNYISLPYVIDIGNFTDATPTDTRIIDIPVHPTLCKNETYALNWLKHYPTYLMNWAKGFRWWTGSIKFKLIFTCSSLISARVRIAWIPDPTYSAALVSDEDGDVINKVFDIKGDTTVTFNIPYLREKAWLPVVHPNYNIPPVTNWDYANGQLIVSVKVSPTVGQPDATPTVDYALEIAGGEDFRCAEPTMIWPSMDVVPPPMSNKSEIHGQMESVSKLTAVSDNREEFRQPFEGLVPAVSCIQTGVTMGEEVQSWPEYLKRYTSYSAVDASIISTLEQLNPWNVSTVMTQWHYHMKCWLFHRGSLRFKTICMTTNERFTQVWYNNRSGSDAAFPFEAPSSTTLMANLGSNGLCVFDSNLSTISEVQLPFYYDCNMVPMGMQLGRNRLPNIGFTILSGPETTAEFQIFISVGDDYTCGYPLPPPPLYCQAVLSAQDLQGAPTKKVERTSGNSGNAQISLSGKATPKPEVKRGNNNTK